MKKVLRKQYAYCLGLLLSLLVPSALAQPAPFEGANVILITTDLADKEAYITVGNVLTEQGIVFSATDDCLLINLPVKASEPGKTTEFVGQLSVNAGLVKLTGRMQSASEPTNEQPMKSTPLSMGYAKDKRKTSLSQVGFLYLVELAKKLRRPLHGIISYKMMVPSTEETASY
ncbi:hypothetical protein [Spirosoma linguale]|uniref:Uncharacterized protein n=1 Tax=Spirosoma linguale (strain ATCC 33905 / DSM 74 / LMG 10896 / Claus 1) TaxID=504472 RepID=D2QPY8_SPILD|nr:hypothetical protein Slin_1674 [Spirosoma linguale DSM 74]